MSSLSAISATHPGPVFLSSLTIKNQFDELVRVVAWLKQAAEHYQLPERTVFKLDVVLNEALPNIISYAYPSQSSHEIAIRLENSDEQVLLEIIDDGIAFNPFTTAPPPEQNSLESASIGGRGIPLIKSYTDAQEYHRSKNTNIMRIVIRKSPHSFAKHP